MSWNIAIERSKSSYLAPKESELGFGKHFAAHMLVTDYINGAWQSPKIIPFSNFSLSPAASVFHYAQALFEGMKAYRGSDGAVRLFRTKFNAHRMRVGAERLCLPGIPEDNFVQAVEELVKTDLNCVPKQQDCSLYIRPTMIATEPFLGVRPAQESRFYIISSPVGSYYKEGFAPVKIWVEEEFVRACPGGTGAVKASGNYSSSLMAAQNAKARGYSQVLWLDAVERKYVEEVGTMNIFFRFKDEVVTPSLEGTVLPGCTRDSVITLLKDWGVPIVERRIAIKEVLDRANKGELLEVFGTGTAVVVSSVGELAGSKFTVKLGTKVGDLTQRLYDEITGIQYGNLADRFHWTTRLN